MAAERSRSLQPRRRQANGSTRGALRRQVVALANGVVETVNGTPVKSPLLPHGIVEHDGFAANGRRWRLLEGDVRVALSKIQPKSVSCVVTSPPYYWQRDYGVGGQIGHEPTIEAYVSALVTSFRPLKNVLADTGVFFLNLGDTFYSAKGRPHGKDKKNSGRQWARTTLRAVDGPGLGLPRKSLIGIPWRVALALQQDGWTLRSDVVWKRPGTLPEPTAHDRPWLTHEHIFIFSKGPRYWFNRSALDGEEDLWHIPARPDMPGTHFAPFPSALVEKCLKCGCPPGGTVLDPFVGSGTTMAVGLKLGFDVVGIELKPEYCTFIRDRMTRTALEDLAIGTTPTTRTSALR